MEEAPAIEPESRAGASVVRDPATGRGVLTGAGVEEVMAAEGGRGAVGMGEAVAAEEDPPVEVGVVRFPPSGGVGVVPTG